MRFVALARIDVLIPFDFDAPELDLAEHLGDVGDGTQSIIDVDAYEKKLSEVERGRIAAACHAESEILSKVKASVGDIVDTVVVEVREA